MSCTNGRNFIDALNSNQIRLHVYIPITYFECNYYLMLLKQPILANIFIIFQKINKMRNSLNENYGWKVSMEWMKWLGIECSETLVVLNLKVDISKLAQELKWGLSEFVANEEGRGKGLTRVYELNATRDESP